MKRVLCGLAALSLLAVTNAPARADFIQWNVGQTFSTGAPPPGGFPALVVKIEDIADIMMVDSVRFTLDAGPENMTVMGGGGALGAQLTDGFVSAWFFNLADSFFNSTTGNLINTATVSNISSTVGSVTPSIKKNDKRADGDGDFDVRFDFPTTVGNNRIRAGDLVTFDFSLSGVSAQSFNFFSVKGGDQGIFNTAAHIQGIADSSSPTGTRSTWVGNPAPSGLIGLLGIALTGLPVFRRWKRLPSRA